jgi:hypothetical protein
MIRYKYNILWAFLLLVVTGNAYAGGFFKNFAGRQAPSSGKQVLVPEQYRIVSADQQGLMAYMSALSADAAKASVISLPAPDGTATDFYVWKTTMMEEPLQQRYQQIQTFTAVAKNNKNITAKLDFTVNGFHAMIFDGERTFMIDPYADVSDGYYSVYYKKDYKRPVDQVMNCEIGDEQRVGNLHGNIDGTLAGSGQKQYGSTKKSFRLALACTGEYATAVGGATPTKASVLSAMVTSMNRVNGIYERELGVTMILIGNDTAIIYLDPNNDPFTANNNGNQLLGQNQNNTASVIGNANYDIGHIFSTGGGGVAFLGCVCKNNQKARGVTGSANPVGDAYDVDYVAHEMGHQFAGDHSFNKCSGTENEETAFEPGSGSTIMAYAGICGPYNDIQPHSDAYFHAISLLEITDFLENNATCALDDVNGTPLVTLPSITAVYNIPYQTPFELQAPLATAASSDSITYCWEQTDLGNYQQSDTGSANFTAGPSFRSFTPTTSRWRVFPRIDSIIKNITAYQGEKLSAVARTLTFGATARNLKSGFGSIDISDGTLTLHVINTGAPFKVTSPDVASEVAYALAPKAITWNVVQTDVAPISAANVDIFLSVDGGYTYPFSLASGVPNNGSATVTMPDTSSTKARVKVKGAGNVFFDISDANFTLVDTVNITSIQDVTLDNDLSVYPNPASTQINITNKGTSALALVLFNTLGQKVWEGKMMKKITIPVAAYAHGLYYLQINDQQKGSKTVKRITLQ